MFTGHVGPVEVFFYWPEAVLGNFYWPGAIGLPLASSPASCAVPKQCQFKLENICKQLYYVTNHFKFSVSISNVKIRSGK